MPVVRQNLLAPIDEQKNSPNVPGDIKPHEEERLYLYLKYAGIA